ncbi:MAG: TIGR03435 family protein [Acidobacteriaceae bacterium]
MLQFRPRLIVLALPLALLLISAAPARAQTAPDAMNPPLAFDAVSIREAQPDPRVVSTWNATSDSFRATITVESFVQSAYEFVLEDQILGLPGWAKSERFLIAAKMDPETYAAFNTLPGPEQARQWQRMLQNILTTRFQMRAHQESRPMPAYALRIAKGGPKLKTAGPDPGGWSAGRGRLTGQSMDMSTLAGLLSGSLSSIVVDQTGLTGKYDVTLTWTPDDQRGLPDSGPSLFTALQEGLGLRLESTRAPVPVLVIDSIEKPSAN